MYHQFVYWRRKLLEAGVAGTHRQPEEQPAGFARVSQVMNTSVVQPDSELTVSLPGGIAITGLHSGNVSLLGDILRQL